MVNKIIKKKEILFLLSFPTIPAYSSQNKLFINEICNNFKHVYFVNSDNLVERTKVKKYNNKNFLNLPKKVKFFNPIDYNSLDLFLKNKSPLVIYPSDRTFKHYSLLFYLKKRNVTQVEIGNIGNIQAGLGDYQFSHILHFIKRFFIKIIFQKIAVILSALGIFQKIDIKFLSNRALYNFFIKRKKKFFKLPSFYKEFVLVKSKQFDYFNKIKKKLTEDIILLLDIDVDWPEVRFTLPPEVKDSTGKIAQNLVDEHYKKLNQFLEKLSKIFKKKIIISIHPGYNLKNTIRRFNGKYPVIKYRTEKLIQKSFLVLDFGSSAIINAVFLKKKIISLRSELFKEKKYLGDINSKALNLKVINIYKKIKINKGPLIKDLKSRFKYYDKYLKKYAASEQKISGNKKIIKVIKSRYF